MNKQLATLLTTLLVSMTSQAGARENITYLLPAPPTLPAFAPWIIAKQKGYYDTADLNVTFVAARGGVDVAKQIGAGNAVIGGAIGDTPIIVRPNGIPVKTVALLGGGSLTMIAVNKPSGIQAIKDLKGKTMTVVAYSDTTYYALLGSLKKNGLDQKQVSIQAAGPTGVWQIFANGQAAAMAGVPDWVVNAQESGQDIELLPAEQQFKSMPQAILASDETIRNNPEMIHKLVQATLRGMKDVIDDPDDAAQTFAAAVPSYQGKENHLRSVFELYRTRVYSGQETPGMVDPAHLEAVQDFYLNEGIITKTSPLSDLYTNQFITSRHP